MNVFPSNYFELLERIKQARKPMEIPEHYIDHTDMKVVFISHPYSDNPKRNLRKHARLMKRLHKQYPNILFICPLFMFQYITEETPYIRENIMRYCRTQIRFNIDELWNYGNTDGCIEEIELANSVGMYVKHNE